MDITGSLVWSLIRHAGPDPASRDLEKTGCARSLRSLRLPSVARLEFIPMEIGAGMTPLF
jgi:hypothetical protein